MPQQKYQTHHNPKPKPKIRYSQLFRFSQDSANNTNQMYQIQPFQIEQNSLTHSQVNSMIQNWGTFAKIQQKFFVWEFSFGYQKILNIVPQNFYNTAIHYVFMKKLSGLMKDFDQTQVLKKSLQLKEIYKVQSLAGKLKGKRFDYLLLVTVKLVGFFLRAHTHEIIINNQLEAQIYTILIYVLLGTEVGEKSFSNILQRYKQKRVLKYNGRSDMFKHSIILPNMSKQSSQHKEGMRQTAGKSKKRLGRTQCRTGTALFHQLPQHYEEDKYAEMRSLVKANLLVKEFVPKPKLKQTLDQLLAKAKNLDTQKQELRQAKTMEKKQMKHKNINYTQMSCSLDLNKSSESLNTIHNHSLKMKPQKKSKYYQMIKKQDLISMSMPQQIPVKLPKIQKPKQEIYSYQAMVQKKKSGNYWKKIIGQMKENKFQNIEHFPPISAKMYFQKGELDDEKKGMRLSETVDVIQTQQNKENHDSYHGQFLTQRIVQTQKNLRETQHAIPTSTKLYKKSAQQILQKTSILPALQQLKNQVNILQYSVSTNVKQIYKDNKAFMNVYSSQPLDDLNTNLKKKSFVQLREVEKKFIEECAKRREKIQHSYFA